jgi:membrane-bound serine protease (ClpP class)
MPRIFLALIAVAGVWLASVPSPAQNSAGSAIVLDIDGAIGPAAAEYIHDGLTEARRRQAAAVVLRMDTPGGLSSSMRDIIREILDSPVPVIVYVGPSGARAASAGTYILYASHVAAMAPSTHLGAATPVQIGGGLFDGKDDDKKDGDKDKNNATPASASEAKAINDAVAYIRSLAQLRGRNAEWGEKAVREAATLTDSEARDQRVIEIVAADLSDLLKQADGRTVKVAGKEVTLKTAGLSLVEIEPDSRARILSIITNPTIAYLLLLAGIYGLMFEFISPGTYFPGVLGGIALLVGLYALNLLPINYAGAGLLLLGVALMAAEAFLPSFGVIGIGGIAAFVIGSLFLFRGDVPGFQLAWQAVAATTVASAAFLIVAVGAALRAHRRVVVIGDAAFIGSAAEVLAWSGDRGEVQIHGERWRATSAAALIPGQRVRIVARRDLTLTVEPEAAVSTDS